MEITEQLERIERLLFQKEQLQERLCIVAEKCERHLYAVSAFVAHLANIRNDGQIDEAKALAHRLRRENGEHTG